MVTCDDFVLDLVARELCFMSIIRALTSLLDSALRIVAQVRIYSRLSHSLCIFRLSHVHDHSGYWLIYSSIVMIASFYQQKPDFRDLEGCYGFYYTFPISNLTLEPDPVFSQPAFSKIRSHTQGFLSYFVYPLKIKQK